MPSSCFGIAAELEDDVHRSSCKASRVDPVNESFAQEEAPEKYDRD